MARLIVCGLCGWIAVMATTAILAQEPKPPPAKFAADPNDPNHDELRALRAAVTKAINDKDIDALLKHVHANVVVVWQNAEISRGHQGVRDYYEKYMGGPEAVLESYTVEPEVAELTILYAGNTGISYGTTISHFRFKNGRMFDLNGPWSATLVKEDNRWQIASFHASAGLFDNPVLTAAKKALYWGCGIAGALGLIVGVSGMVLLRRRKKP